MEEPGEIKRILLIVDNSLLVIERLTGILKEIKCIHKIVIANDYSEAVIVLKERSPDFVLLDIQLPGKNGIELLRFIIKNYPHIKVVMFSNLVSEYYQRLCKKIGALYFIDKSRDFELIPEVVAALC